MFLCYLWLVTSPPLPQGFIKFKIYFKTKQKERNKTKTKMSYPGRTTVSLTFQWEAFRLILELGVSVTISLSLKLIFHLSSIIVENGLILMNIFYQVKTASTWNASFQQSLFCLHPYWNVIRMAHEIIIFRDPQWQHF